MVNQKRLISGQNSRLLAMIGLTRIQAERSVMMIALNLMLKCLMAAAYMVSGLEWQWAVFGLLFIIPFFWMGYGLYQYNKTAKFWMICILMLSLITTHKSEAAQTILDIFVLYLLECEPEVKKLFHT